MVFRSEVAQKPGCAYGSGGRIESLSPHTFRASLFVILEGRRTAPGASRGRKVRTPQGAMLGNPDWSGIHSGGQAARPADGQCHRNLNRLSFARNTGKGEKVG